MAWKLGDVARAQREARKLAKEWSGANPRQAGETKAAYRKRMMGGIETKLARSGASPDWIALILKIIEMIAELFG
jgi:hypothetical protein